MGSLLELLSGGGNLTDLLRKKSMGGAGSNMSGPVAGAVLPQNSFNQYMSGSPTATNPMMSSVIGATATTPAPKQSNHSWEKWAQPQDVSAGLVAGQANDPMYNQMMQQSMQGQQQPQPQKQIMTPAAMPQMPGAVYPNANWDTLLKMLSGGR